MGIQPSKTELFLPSDTLRKCDPERCWCDRPHHPRSRYVYVERGGDGNERFHDPVDMMNTFMMGGMSPNAMPWKDPGAWTTRDFERFGEVFGEYLNRERGRRPPGPPPGYGNNYNWGPPPNPYDDYRRPPHRRSHRSYPSRSEFERMQEGIDDKMRRMWENYSAHMAERDAIFFGTDADRRKDQYRSQMVKTLQEIMPQLQQMWAWQAMYGGNGGGNGGGMPMGGMMGGNPMMGMPPPNGPPQGMGGGGGMPMGMGMNPMAGPGGMNPNPMMGGNPMMHGGGMNGDMGMGMGGGGGRRNWRRRAQLGLDDAFADDEYDDFQWRRPPPFKRGRGRFQSWDDDMRGGGGGFGDGTHWPRDPFSGGPGLPRRPRPGPGLDGSGGMAFDDPVGFQSAAPRHTRFGAGGPGMTTPPLDMPTRPFRPNPIVTEPRLRPHSPPLAGMGMHTQDTAMPIPPEYDRTGAAAFGPGMSSYRATYHRSSSFDPTMSRRPDIRGRSGLDPALGSGMRTPYPSAAPGVGPFASGAMPYPTGATAAGAASLGADLGEGPSMMRPGMGARGVSFQQPGVGYQPEAGLARPRGEEEARGEAAAGAPASKRDGLRDD